MHLAIQLIGTPQFQLDRTPITASRRAVVALLAYLAVRNLEHPGQRYARESLAALLWTDYEPVKALSNLRHTLWEVNRFIGEGWVMTEHETIFLNFQADLTLDVEEFRSLLEQATHNSDPARRIPLLADASRLYREDFMTGFSLKDGPNFNEWVLGQTEHLRHDFASVLETLIDDYSALNQIPSAIPYAQRLIGLDPIHEAAHRKLMQLYALSDQQAAAIQQYHVLEKLLRKELNLDPQPETRELYKSIRKGEFKPISPRPRAQAMISSKQNLPVHLTTFIGRGRERNDISRLLTHNRMVTLIGAGGIGKTRLALQTAQALLRHYPDGVWFIPFESLADKDLVPLTVASFLGIAESADRAPADALLKELRAKNLLLILDNCEHLLDACAQLAEALLKHCPEIRILTTSRDLLRLEGEAAYHVPPLGIPERQETRSVEGIDNSESVQLFAERAALVLSSFEITETNVETLTKICQRLEGIPLAIELAAAHVDIFTPNEILQQLNHSFDLLVSNTRSTLPRHQTMRASIDWGWNLLTDAEQVFMRRLSVFKGGWTLHAAQAMDLDHVREWTSILVKKSFVVVHQQTEHETRYGFHEVIRSFVQEKLIEAGEEKTMRDRHLEYYLALARQFEPALHGLEQEMWLDRLFTERDNIRAALEWAARTHVQAGLYLSGRLRSLWESYERREEARWLLTI
jgi:predicted ATPase/DNA-binding SARP family transcriptional activator